MTIHTGDCIEVMATMAPESIDAIVTDPPYGIGFMGHEWDQPGVFGALRSDGQQASRRRGHRNQDGSAAGAAAVTVGLYDLAPDAMRLFQAWCEAWAREAYRIAKPGSYILVSGSTRTSHRMACGLEDAGWEIRDTICWGYAQGFPKSLDISKAIDNAAGVVRPIIGVDPAKLRPNKKTYAKVPGDDVIAGEEAQEGYADNGATRTAPVTPDAIAWDGWGTALKPAWEPVVVARKPFRGTVVANVLRHGTGALNIGGTRIPVADSAYARNHSGDRGHGGTRGPDEDGATDISAGGGNASELGRWPANVMLTDPIFDGGIAGVVGGGEQSGGGNPRWASPEASNGQYGGYAGGETGKAPIDTSGTYSRFFLIPKASRAEREPAVRGQLAKRQPPTWSSGEKSPGTFQSQPTPPRENVHPTVKPVELMRHLVRLVTPPGGTVLDPFLGSGTTALACEMEGFGWVGIEREAESVAIAEARLNGQQRGMGIG